MGTRDQALHALTGAVETRRAIGAAKRALKAGEVTPKDAFGGDSPHELGIRRAKLHGLLRAVPNIGPATATDILTRARVDPEARLGDLGYATRVQIAELVVKATETLLETPIVPDDSWRESS